MQKIKVIPMVFVLMILVGCIDQRTKPNSYLIGIGSEFTDRFCYGRANISEIEKITLYIYPPGIEKFIFLNYDVNKLKHLEIRGNSELLYFFSVLRDSNDILSEKEAGQLMEFKGRAGLLLALFKDGKVAYCQYKFDENKIWLQSPNFPDEMGVHGRSTSGFSRWLIPKIKELDKARQ
jgi:hypothetical protein